MAESLPLDNRPVFSTASGIVFAVLIAILGVTAAWTWSHPLPARAVTAAQRQAVESAYQDLKSIAAAPHPIGSPAEADVRNFILGRLKTFGLHPEIQETTFVMQNGTGIYKAALIRNIVARVAGAANTGTILLAAHYDSATYSPGAADDGAGVAALIEMMHAVATGPRLRNDVVALFSDGEEIGLVGARAFMANDPWAKQVRFAANFEARGIQGPSVLFETGAQPGWAIRRFSAASPYLFADSMAPFIYNLLPNDTDFTIFRRASISGFNFAFFDGWPYYHSAADDLSQLSRESLKQQVLIAASVADSFGHADLRSPPKTDAVYFGVFGRWMLIYSYPAALLLAIVALVVLVSLIIFGLRNRRLTVTDLCFGILALPLSAIVVCLASYTVSGSFWALGEAAAYASSVYALSVTALAALLTWGLYLGFSAIVAVENLAVGAMMWCAAFALLTAIQAPALSYLFTWPLLGALLALLVIYLNRLYPRRAGLRLLLLLVASAPTLVIWTGTIRTLYAGLPTREFLVSGLVAFGLGLLILQVRASVGRYVWTITGFLAVASVLTFWIAQRRATFRPSQPKRDSVHYVFDADRNAAAWTTDYPRRDAWTKQFIDGHPVKDIRPPSWYDNSNSNSISSFAPIGQIPAPSVSLTSSSKHGENRVLRLLVKSLRQAPEVVVHIQTKGQIVKSFLDGQNLVDTPLWNGRIEVAHAPLQPQPRSELLLYFYAIQPKGFTLDLETTGLGPVDVDVVDHSYQLPKIIQSRFVPRGSSVVSDGDASLIIRSYIL